MQRMHADTLCTFKSKCKQCISWHRTAYAVCDTLKTVLLFDAEETNCWIKCVLCSILIVMVDVTWIRPILTISLIVLGSVLSMGGLHQKYLHLCSEDCHFWLNYPFKCNNTNLKSNRTGDIFMRTVTVSFSKSVWTGAWACGPASAVMCISRSVIWGSEAGANASKSLHHTVRAVLQQGDGMDRSHALERLLSCSYSYCPFTGTTGQMRGDCAQSRSGFWELTMWPKMGKFFLLFILPSMSINKQYSNADNSGCV